jgi:hypothetical protein
MAAGKRKPVLRDIDLVITLSEAGDMEAAGCIGRFSDVEVQTVVRDQIDEMPNDARYAIESFRVKLQLPLPVPFDERKPKTMLITPKVSKIKMER